MDGAQDLLEAGKNTRDIGIAAQVPAFALNEFMQHVRAIDRDTAATTYSRLAEADYRFKSSQVDERNVLEKLIHSL